MKEGLIPNMNDLGAVHAAQQTIKEHGSDDWWRRVLSWSKYW
jgi:hypothetical protein